MSFWRFFKKIIHGFLFQASLVLKPPDELHLAVTLRLKTTSRIALWSLRSLKLLWFRSITQLSNLWERLRKEFEPLRAPFCRISLGYTMYQREGVFASTKVLLHLSTGFNLRPEAADKTILLLGAAPCIRCRNQLTTWSFKRARCCVHRFADKVCAGVRAGAIVMCWKMNMLPLLPRINKSSQRGLVHNSYLCHSI